MKRRTHLSDLLLSPLTRLDTFTRRANRFTPFRYVLTYTPFGSEQRLTAVSEPDLETFVNQVAWILQERVRERNRRDALKKGKVAA